MKAFLDTSVLVAAFYADHAHHADSFSLFLRQNSKIAAVAAHSLAEVYAATTGMPGKHRAAPHEAMLFLENIRERFTIVELDTERYRTALQRAADAGIAGGGVYDVLLAYAAVFAKASVLYTWNLKHFTRFGADIARRVRTPESAASNPPR